MTTQERTSRTLQIPRTLTVRELADLLGDTPVTIIKTLMVNGVMADVSKTLDYNTAAVVALDHGFEPEEQGDVIVEQRRPRRSSCSGSPPSRPMMPPRCARGPR